MECYLWLCKKRRCRFTLAQKMLNDAQETVDNLEDLLDAVKALPKKK